MLNDLMRRQIARGVRRSPLDIAIDRRIAGGGGRSFQIACIGTLCREIVNGQRKMFVEMVTGTGKTRVAGALLKRLFEASWTTRALFLVDRNQFGTQVETTFDEHLLHLPCCRLPRAGGGFRTRRSGKGGNRLPGLAAS